MRINFENIGALNSCDLELNALTIICGCNNVGKTYLTYAMYGFLKEWQDLLTIKVEQDSYRTLREKGSVRIDLSKYLSNTRRIINAATNKYREQLSNVLAAQENRFSGTYIDFEFNITEKVFDKPFEQEFKSRGGTTVLSFKKDAASSWLEISAVSGESDLSDYLPKALIEDTIKTAVWGTIFPKPFIVSTERTGAITFRSELNLSKNRILDYAHKLHAGEEYSPMDAIQSLFDKGSGYPLPVSDNVDFINSLHKIENKVSPLAKNNPHILEGVEEILGGSYQLTKDGDVNLVLKNKTKLKMGESSSATRSLVILSYYLKHLAKPGDFLIIDEPELNLHPANQRKLARLISRLVNAKIKVFITTHSDYFIKEFNTLIMLNNQSEPIRSIATEHSYAENEKLNPEHVSLYTIKEEELYKPRNNRKRKRGTVLCKADIDHQLGIEAPSFDNTINEMNSLQEKLYEVLI